MGDKRTLLVRRTVEVALPAGSDLPDAQLDVLADRISDMLAEALDALADSLHRDHGVELSWS